MAIIAVLVAIAIPLFTQQLERSRDATSIANLRSAYAEAQAAYLMYDGTSDTQTIDDATINAVNGQIANIQVSGVVTKGTVEGFNGNMQTELPFSVPTDPDLGAAPGTYTITFNYGTNGKITSVTAAKQTA